LQADGDFTRFFIKGSRPIMICHPMGYYEKQLPSPPFYRLDRSHIINTSLTIQLDRKSRDEALLMLDGLVEPLVLGRTAQIRLREFLG
jgi:two-component system LytT family response regulator